jgi:penicillin amidase
MARRIALLIPWALAAILICASFAQTRQVELVRDHWGVPHIFASNENDGFFGVGYASAEDRLLQMDLFRRRANGRLAEVFGAQWAASDRKFRVAGIHRHCLEAVATLPAEMRSHLASYAAGVNFLIRSQPDTVRKRFDKLGVPPEPWTEADCVCSWWAVAELFDSLFDAGAVQSYKEFQQLAAEVGEQEALDRQRTQIDDAAAIVPEAEMAKDAAAYAAVKATPRVAGWLQFSTPDETLRFSHAWAVDGTRTVSGKPLLESDPQTSVNNPPLWYEFHLGAGRFDVRGIGFPGAPALLIGFNRKLAWGATALGAGSNVTYLEKLSADGRSYSYQGQSELFRRRSERIAVKGGSDVVEEVLVSRHGFVFDSLGGQSLPGFAGVSHNSQVQAKATSIRALFGMMAAGSYQEFRAAMEHYYSPGIHLVYADTEGNLAYQTLARVPLTRRTRRMAIEGWTGAGEVLGRVPLDHMPHMLNPDAHFISHANNLPVGSWYPYDLGIGTGGVGHTSRSLRLVEVLRGGTRYSPETFESAIHRDDTNASIAKLFPIARRVAQEMNIADSGVPALLEALKDWDLRYRSTAPGYGAALALGGLLTPYRQSPLTARLGGGEGGIARLARLLHEQNGGSDATPTDRDVRAYLASWIRLAGDAYQKNSNSRATHSMPYQANGPLGFPSLDPRLDLVSPPLSCTQGGTIWSQTGNSYTQIVDLADVDNSRTVLPPGVSEDPASPWYANQMELWAAGSTHPAPLTREKVNAISSSRTVLQPAGLPSQGYAAAVNSASFAAEPVLSPGSLASFFGSGLASGEGRAASFPLPAELAGAQVLVNGAPAPLLFVSPAQINFQVPYGLGGSALLRVVSEGKEVAVAAVRIAAAAPGIFVRAGSVRAAAVNQDGSENSSERPAAAGSVIQIYATGLGELTVPLAAGQPGSSTEPLNRSAVKPQVFVGGAPAEVEFCGVAPGFAGLYQINVRLPENVQAGGAVPLFISAGYLDSNTAMIAIAARTAQTSAGTAYFGR